MVADQIPMRDVMGCNLLQRGLLPTPPPPNMVAHPHAHSFPTGSQRVLPVTIWGDVSECPTKLHKAFG